MKDFNEFKQYIKSGNAEHNFYLCGSCFCTISRVKEITETEIILHCRMFNKYIIVDTDNFEVWRNNSELIIGTLKYGEDAPQWKN